MNFIHNTLNKHIDILGKDDSKTGADGLFDIQGTAELTFLLQ